MGLITTKKIYMKMCHQSNDLYEMTDEERYALQRHLVRMYADIEKNLCFSWPQGYVSLWLCFGCYPPW